jgi:hypothetical protein
MSSATKVGRDHDPLAAQAIHPGAGDESEDKARQQFGYPQHADSGW